MDAGATVVYLLPCTAACSGVVLASCIGNGNVSKKENAKVSKYHIYALRVRELRPDEQGIR